MWLAKAFHCFSEVFQRCLVITTFRDIDFQHLILVVNSPPELMSSASNLYKISSKCIANSNAYEATEHVFFGSPRRIISRNGFAKTAQSHDGFDPALMQQNP